MKAKLPLVYGMIVSMFSEVFETEPGASLRFFRKMAGDPHLTARCTLRKEGRVYSSDYPISELGFVGTEIEAEIANRTVVTMTMEIKKQVEETKKMLAEGMVREDSEGKSSAEIKMGEWECVED